MDFDDTPEEAAFRKEARAWLEANAPRRAERAALSLTVPDEAAELVRARAWQAKKAAAGYAEITWPKEYGGRGGTAMEAVIYAQEEAQFVTPQGFFPIGLMICVPILMQFGRPEHKARYLKPALYGEEIWCQLFSEPSGGSDVAGARLRAVRQDDGDWVLNGQKVWCSGGHYADYGVVVTRSDPSKPKHAGLTFFWVDMKAPGVEVRPIKQATGMKEFNEVFFTDVRIPDSQRLGGIDEGWKVVVHTLMLERQAVGAGYANIAGWRDAYDVARRSRYAGRPALEDPRVRERLADAYLTEQALQLNNFQALTALSRGETPGPEFAIGKLIGASALQQLGYLMMDLEGARALQVVEDDPVDARINYAWLWGAAARIAGGTDEIIKNILAERVLGLPPDIRLDKDRPFSEIPG